MLLQETKLLKFHKNQWILDLRFSDYNLKGIEHAVYLLVQAHGQGLASTNDTGQIKKEANVTKELARKNKVLKGPLYKINGIPYISHGWGCGHIGYFMDEFPEYQINDPCPYDRQAAFIDDVDSLYLSQAFTKRPVYIDQTYRSDYIYHWKNIAYWIGEGDTDVGLHVFERRAKEPIPLKMVQNKLF